MPLMINAIERKITKNFDGKTKAKISPNPSITNKMPRFVPPHRFICDTALFKCYYTICICAQKSDVSLYPL